MSDQYSELNPPPHEEIPPHTDCELIPFPEPPQAEEPTIIKPTAPRRSDWPNPDLSILTGGQFQVPRFPSDIMTEQLRAALTNLASSKGAPVDYVFAGILSVAASLVGNSRWIQAWPGWREPCCLWVGALGGPSSGKSPGLDPALTVARKIEAKRAEQYPEQLRQWETNVERAKLSHSDWLDDLKTGRANNLGDPVKPPDAVEPDKPPRPRAVVIDTTVEQLALILAGNPKGTLLFRDELSGFLGSHGRYGGDADRPFYLEAYGGRSFAVDRVRRPDPILIPRMTLSILGGIQPDRLNTLLMKADDDGLAARFLFVWPDTIPLKRPQTEYDLSKLHHAFNRLDELQMIEGENGLEPQILSLSDNAADIHDQHRLALLTENTDTSGLYGSFVGKVPGLALRLAGTLSLLEWAFGDEAISPSEIDDDVITRTWSLLLQYFLPMAKKTYGDALTTNAERNAKAIATEIMNRRELTINARTIRKNWSISGLNKANDVDAALKILEENGWVKPNSRRSGNTTGRPAKDHDVNPDLFNEF